MTRVCSQGWSHPDSFQQQPGPTHRYSKDGDFASLARFNHLEKTTSFRSDFIWIANLSEAEKIPPLVRPSLRLNGYPTSLKLLEEIKLVITSYDHATNRPVWKYPSKNDPREEFAHEFRVPERTPGLKHLWRPKLRAEWLKEGNQGQFFHFHQWNRSGHPAQAPFFIVHRMDLSWKYEVKMGSPSSIILYHSVLNMLILDGPEIIPKTDEMVIHLDSFPILNGYR